MKKCPQCQQESLDSARFCANCGAPLETSSSTPKLSRQAKRQSVLQSDPAPIDDSKKKEDSSLKENGDPSNSSKKESELKEDFSKEEMDLKENDKEKKTPSEKDEKKKESKWQAFLFQKKSDEKDAKEDEEDDEVEDHPEDMQKMLFIAVCFLGLLVIFLSGLLIYQDFSSNPSPSQPVAIENQEVNETEVNETFEVSQNVSTTSSKSEESKAATSSTKTFSITHEDSRVLPRRAGEPKPSSEASSEKSSTTSASSSTHSADTTTYQANYVMNVRTGPSTDEEQVSQIDEGEMVDIDQTEKKSDGSTWGRLENSDHWVCLKDEDTQYFTKIDTENESAAISKVDVDALIAQSGSIWNLFDDAVLIGDSRVYGFMSYGFVPANQVLAAGGYTIQNIPEYLGNVALLQPEVIYLSFGINDMGLNIGQEEGENGYAKVYTRQIQSLLEQAPQALIVVNSVIDATPTAVANSPRWNKVADFNRQIKQMCQANGWIYVDNDDLAQGGTAPIYNADGVHLVSTFYEPWAKNMLKARFAHS